MYITFLAAVLMRPKGVKRRRDSADSEPQPVRRSARLAGLPPPQPTKATVEIELPPSPSGSAVEFWSQADAGDPLAWLPKMHLAVAPPETIAAGLALTSPVLVTFEVSDADQEKDDADSSSVDFSSCWAFLSLVSEDRKQILAPPRKNLLEGTISDSIHELDRPQDEATQIIGYAVFKDLKILEPGRYCFGVNVVDMKNTTSSAEVKISKVIHSDTFQVVDQAQAHGASSTPALARLREIGVQI